MTPEPKEETRVVEDMTPIKSLDNLSVVTDRVPSEVEQPGYQMLIGMTLSCSGFFPDSVIGTEKTEEQKAPVTLLTKDEILYIKDGTAEYGDYKTYYSQYPDDALFDQEGVHVPKRLSSVDNLDLEEDYGVEEEEQPEQTSDEEFTVL